MPGIASLLDPRKTTGSLSIKAALDREKVFESSGTTPDRWQAAIALNPITINHLTRYIQCGTNAWIQESKSTGRFRLTSNTCKLRVCPHCRRLQSKRIRERLQYALIGMSKPNWRLITLTMSPTDSPLADQITELRVSFKRLRQSPMWNRHVRGGYCILEVTYNADKHWWHPHLHLIVEGIYFDQKQLSHAWAKASKGSYIVDIRKVHRTKQAVDYLTAYLGKLDQSFRDQPPEVLNEYYRSLHGQRLLVTFGNVPRVPPHTHMPSDYPTDWTNVAPLWETILGVHDGFVWAIVLYRKLTRVSSTGYEGADYHPPPPWNP